MSKIGNKKIKILKNINLEINLNIKIIKIGSSLGELHEILLNNIIIICENDEIYIYYLSENPLCLKFFGLFRSLIYNMIHGILNKWSKLLIIDGIGYKFTIENNNLQIFSGFSHNIFIIIPNDISISLLSQSRILINGINKSKVGLFAAKIKGIKKPEPYGGKGIRYNTDVLIKKIGKKEKKTKKIKK